MQAKKRRRGFSLIELLIVISIILIIAAIAVPKMNRQLMLAREQAAIRQIGTIHQAETQYYSQYGRYAQNLSELGPPASGAPRPPAADIISKSLSEGKNGGFPLRGVGAPPGYPEPPAPEAFGSSPSRTFFSDQTLVVRQNLTAEPAN